MTTIYTLELEHGKYYVGRSTFPKKRILAHFTTNGSEWTKLHPPVRVISQILGDEFDEEKYTLIAMNTYGVDNVRGGSYCTTTLSKFEQETAQQTIWSIQLHSITDITENQIIPIQNIIARVFYDSGIRSACLAQSYTLYKYILNKSLTPPQLIKGYIVNHPHKIYYGHFWVEHNDKIYDPATISYLMDFDIKCRESMKLDRTLETTISSNILSTYTNIDNSTFHITRDHSYDMCLNDKFLEDVKKNAPSEVYAKIRIIYNKINK